MEMDKIIEISEEIFKREEEKFNLYCTLLKQTAEEKEKLREGFLMGCISTISLALKE